MADRHDEPKGSRRVCLSRLALGPLEKGPDSDIVWTCPHCPKDHDVTPKQQKKRNPIEDLLHPPHVSQRCGAKARSTGEPCKRYASIEHTRCKFHGGAKGSGRPIIHGEYSAETHRRKVVIGALMRMVRLRYKKPDPIEV